MKNLIKSIFLVLIIGITFFIGFKVGAGNLNEVKTFKEYAKTCSKNFNVIQQEWNKCILKTELFEKK